MAILTIPTSTTLSSYTQRTVLDGTSYQLDFKFNQREDSWYISLLSETGDPIIMGIKVIIDWPLLRRVKVENAPPGELYALDTTGVGTDPGLNDLGGRVVLLYLDEAEVNS